MQAGLHLLYPPQCISCDARVTTDFGLCGSCWSGTPFLAGLVCDSCGVPLIGDEPEGRAVHCDSCRAEPPPWSRGRAALRYAGRARGLVLALKRGDRVDLAKAAAPWMVRALAPIAAPDMLVAPIPLHWMRLLRRSYNQSALLSREVARLSGLQHCPDLLTRKRNTASQEGRNKEARFANVKGSLVVSKSSAARVVGRHVLLVDDVLTSGATLHAATTALLAGGAREVCVLTLSRVVKDA